MHLALHKLIRPIAPALVLLVAACQELPEQTGLTTHVTEMGRIAEVNPNDIVVAPIQLGDDELSVPQRALREAFVSKLVARRYAPLSLDLVDEGVVEASYRTGILQEDAVLLITVHDWDRDTWSARHALDVDIEVRLVDPRDQSGAPLWAARLDDRFDFTHWEERHATPDALLRAALEHVASQLLVKLPQRVVAPEAE
jgi:hypothetical protein